jgi:hypothetical protein
VRVWVVDDYPENVISMAMLLRLYSHEVDTAFSGRKASAVPPSIPGHNKKSRLS